MKTGKLHIGTSGYSFADWRGVLYPKDLPQKEWLEEYARHFGTVELNVTFYRLPKEAVFAGWHDRTPRNFLFALKGWRRITHFKSLKDCAELLDVFFEHSSALGKKLAVILWQLPPNLQADLPRLESFIDLARELSPVRQVFEFRNPAWFNDDVYRALTQRDMGLCLSDMPKCAIDGVAPAKFVYIRRHGPKGDYRLKYTPAAMKKLAGQIKDWSAKGKEVFVYFNNDAVGNAVVNARQVIKAVG